MSLYRRWQDPMLILMMIRSLMILEIMQSSNQEEVTTRQTKISGQTILSNSKILLLKTKSSLQRKLQRKLQGKLHIVAQYEEV